MKLQKNRKSSDHIHNTVYSKIKLSVFIWEVSQPALVGSHLILPGSHLDEMKIFYMNMRKWASPAKWDRIFFNQFCFVFQMLIK